MPNIYSGLVHINGNMLASVDLETTGRRPGHHEIIQIAVVPLNSDIRPLEGVRPFYHNIRPLHPERADGKATQVHGIKIEDLILHAPHPGKVADLLREWWERLDLPASKTLVPLAHNWAFESAFLTAWLGIDEKQTLFHSHARDAFLLASFDERPTQPSPAKNSPSTKSASAPSANISISPTKTPMTPSVMLWPKRKSIGRW